MHKASAFAAALLVALSVPALAAALQVPSPSFSTVPTGIVLVGETGGVPDPLGFFAVTVRDESSNLIANITVTIHFTNTPDVSISSSQSYPGLAVECPPANSDYDFDGSVGSSDLVFLLDAMLGRNSLATPALCTPFPGPPAEVVQSSGGLRLEKLDCTSGGSPNYDPDFCAGPTSRYTEIVGSVNCSPRASLKT